MGWTTGAGTSPVEQVEQVDREELECHAHSKSVRSLKRIDDVAAWASCHSCREPMVMCIRILRVCVRAIRI
jgi:hypothetical protein